MKKAHKLVSAVLVSTMVLSMTACGSGEKTYKVDIGADSVGRTTAYGLIDADQFAAGSTDWQPVTMWQG